jgi:CubicO group peptidase (beta-lactamase class C family)
VPTEDEILDAVKSYPLSNPPYSPPLYSNTGYALLGMAAVAANSARESESAPKTYVGLIHRDIFEPLGLNGSSFRVTDENRARVAVASVHSDEVVSDYGYIYSHSRSLIFLSASL